MYLAWLLYLQSNYSFYQKTPFKAVYH